MTAGRRAPDSGQRETCECGHRRGYHDAIGNCWHLDEAGDEDCGCDQYRAPVLASDDRTRGLYGKYRVERVSDPDGKHDHCRYFVLDPQHDPHAVTALRAYADAVRDEYPQLAADLDDWTRAAAEAVTR